MHYERLPDPAHLTLGQYLLAARLEQGISRRRLATLSGVNRMTVERLEKDQVEGPSPDHLARLGRALEVNQADLFLLAGIPLPTAAASLDVMLRTSYDLPPEAITRIKRSIQEIVDEYDRT